MTIPLRILLLEDNPLDAELVRERLEAHDFACDVTRVETRAEFVAALQDGAFDLILADYRLPSFDGLSALAIARETRPDLPFIFVSGTLGDDVAIEAVKVGATDYVVKSRLARIVPSVRRALGEAQERAEREKAEEALRRLEADLAHMNRVSMMGELAAALAHEIRQPLAAAITNANACTRWLGRDEPNLGEASKAAAGAVESMKRASGIIDRISSLYRRGPSERDSVDVNALIREMTDLLADTAARNSVSIRAELDPGLPAATADRIQVQQVVMNLMLNGIEAMQDTGGELTIASKRTEDGQLLISISDSGVGFSKDEAERVFDAFFTTKPQGTGMGLSISHRIVESHGGRLWANPNAPRGAVFQFTLPAGSGGSVESDRA